MIDPAVILRHATPVPRYTSYPTANHFATDVGPDDYASWLEALTANAKLSLYVHIPYCRDLCWYCACNTRAVRRYEPIASYIDVLLTEVAHVAARLTTHHSSNIHFGGGSPDILSAHDLRRIAAAIRNRFEVSETAEIAIEVDPRLLDPERVSAFADIGINRASLGVQDFDDRVQAAIGRVQSFEVTRRAIEDLRSAGIGSINIDLVYGLPYQTMDSVNHTIDRVVSLAPDRIATFGYAHLPRRMKHQRLIEAAHLPGAIDRYEMSQLLTRRFVAAGYRRIGLDHFARPADPLAASEIHRNFQGYTVDDSDALIGIGASAIGKLPRGYVQNATTTADYARRIAKHGYATVRGIALSLDDSVRALTIERLMCANDFSERVLTERFGAAAAPIVATARHILDTDPDGLLEATGDGFRMTELGRPFVRSICARFDTYLQDGVARHSMAV